MDPRLAVTRPPGDGIVCGIGTIDGLPIAITAHDPTVLRGAVGSAGCQKLCKLLDMAIERKLPMLTLADSDGARVFEGVYVIEGWSQVMKRTVRHRRLAPHLTIASGLCVGAVAYNAMLADFVAMVHQQSFMFITGPSVTQMLTGEEVDIERLGGAALHARETGACHAVCDSEEDAFLWAKTVFDYTLHPQRETEDSPTCSIPSLQEIIPTAPQKAYDMRDVLLEVFDKNTLIEFSADYAPNLLTCMGRLGGRSVAIIASQPRALMGCLDIHSSKKGAPFLEYAETHQLPVITLVDTTGYLPGLAQERGGILIEGARLLRAYAELTTPTVSVTLRKCYGGASVLASASEYRLALPTSEIAPMGAEAATHLAFGPPRDNEQDRAQREAFKETWRQHHGDPWLAAERGFFDAIIHPEQLRAALCRSLRVLTHPNRD
tara:strand:+ start:4297 stop:5598 length:1302 start_codon:yes stop_codon:yes gene_type:complete